MERCKIDRVSPKEKEIKKKKIQKATIPGRNQPTRRGARSDPKKPNEKI